MFMSNKGCGEIRSGAVAATAQQNAVVNAALLEKSCTDTQCSPERPKVALELLDDMDGIIRRAMSVSDRLETVADRMFGSMPEGKDECSPPQVPGAVGVMAAKLHTIRRVLDALEAQTYRIEQIA